MVFQSHEGGSMHTDNVNVPDTWEYMILTCLQPAAKGGESLLVSVARIHEHLRVEHPEALSVLTDQVRRPNFVEEIIEERQN